MNHALQVELHGISLAVQVEDEQARAYCLGLLDHFLASPAPIHQSDVQVRIRVVDTLPVAPPRSPYFTSRGSGRSSSEADVSAFRGQNEAIEIRYDDGAVVRLPGPVPKSAEVFLERSVFSNGRYEDACMAALAALLRPWGIYVVHAFAAEKDGQAILLVGESGSGKTTTGLNLMAHGWRYLANDLALLRRKGDDVYALPSPGGFSIRSQTFRLLPQLKPLAEHYPAGLGDAHQIPARAVVPRWAAPAPVRCVLFPIVTGAVATTLHRLRPAVALARLMEESVDRWDEASLAGHLTALEALCRQAPSATLALGRDIDRLPAQLERVLAAPETNLKPHPSE
jgi:hypothetical protein